MTAYFTRYYPDTCFLSVHASPAALIPVLQAGESAEGLWSAPPTAAQLLLNRVPTGEVLSLKQEYLHLMMTKFPQPRHPAAVGRV